MPGRVRVVGHDQTHELLLDFTILRGKDWCFTQFSTEMAGWLLLIFFICLYNQLSSITSTDA